MLPIILIFIIAVIIGIFIYQNWILVPPLIFLGLQSKSLPLALLIIFAFTLGLITILIISLLNNLVINRLQAEIAALENSQNTTDTQAQRTQTSSANTYTKPNNTTYTRPNNNDSSDDWDNIDNTPTDQTTPQDWEEVINDLETSQVKQPNISNKPRSAAVYSYTYRESKNSPSIKSDKVYDADYRVIKSSEQSQPENNQSDWESPAQKNQDDEWDF
jgi:hypothetical protein